MQRYDVIVVGSGPAGAITAYELAARGREVLLLEKKKLPRYKPCGGGLSAKVKKILPQEIIVDDLIQDETKKVVFTYRYRNPLTVEFSEPLIQMIMRDTFDQRLVEYAVAKGVTLKDGTEYQAIEENHHGVIIDTNCGKFEGRYLVAANGAHSRISKQLGMPLDFSMGMAIEDELETSNEIVNEYKSSILLNHGSIPQGYGWIFPKKNHLSVGTGSFAPGVKKLAASLDKLENRMQISKQTINKRQGHPIPVLQSNNPCWHTEKTVVVGDAAGLIDPFCGEGIYYAVRSGQLAAMIIDGVISNKEKIDAYTQEVKAAFWKELQTASKIAHVVYAFPGIIQKMVHQDPEIAKRLLRVVFGDLSYEHLFTYLKERYSLFR